MKTIKYCVVILLTVIFYSCNQFGKSASADFSNVTQIIYDTVNSKWVNPEQIVERCKFVKLETDPKCLIGKVDKILFADSSIIIVDKSIAKSIFVFDMNGNFKNKVSRVGNASNEYLNLVDVFIGPELQVFITDNSKRKLLSFTLDGRFLGAKDNPISNFDMNYINDNRFAIFSSFNLTADGNRKIEKTSYAIVDKDLKLIYTFGDEPHEKHPSFNLTRWRNIFRYGDRVYCTLNFGNDIYELGADSVKVKYKLSITPGTLYEPADEDFESHLTIADARKGKPFFYGDFFECKDFSCFLFIMPPFKQQWVFYNHNTRSVMPFSDKTSDPLLDFFYSPNARCGDNTLVESVSATNICMTRDYYEKEGIHSEQLDQLFEGMTVDSNPVLFFYDINLGEL